MGTLVYVMGNVPLTLIRQTFHVKVEKFDWVPIQMWCLSILHGPNSIRNFDVCNRELEKSARLTALILDG